MNNQAVNNPPKPPVKRVDSLNRNISKSFGTNNTCIDTVQSYQNINGNDHQR